MRAPALQVLRVVAAAGLAWSAAMAWDLPQAHWAMISALMVVQGTFGATVRAGRDRILATGCGAAMGALAGIAHAHGWPVLLTWALALLPTVAIANIRRELRIAPIAAIIVASSTLSAASPLSAAFLRIGEISLGALIGVAASRWLLPASTLDRLRSHAVRLLAASSPPLARAEHVDSSASEMRANRIRSSLQEIALIARSLRHEDESVRAYAIAFAKNLRRLHEDLMFLKRISMQARLQTPELAPMLDGLDSALRDALETARSKLLDSHHASIRLLHVDALIPIARNADDARAAEIKAALRFAVQSINRQLKTLTST